MDLFDKSYISILESLLRHQVRFVLLGGLAVNLYGYRRATGDMDILFEASETNAFKLLNSLAELDYDISLISADDLKSDINFRLGEAPKTVDFMNATKGLNYEVVFKQARIFDIEGLQVPVIHINHLIENKVALNTYKDLADAEKLREIQKRQ